MQELIEKYGPGAILTVDPYVQDSGETLRWVVQIDGADVNELDVRVQEHPERDDMMIMYLVVGDENIELHRWSTRRDPYGPARVMRRLRELLP
jgi:hypothetical protein